MLQKIPGKETGPYSSCCLSDLIFMIAEAKLSNQIHFLFSLEDCGQENDFQIGWWLAASRTSSEILLVVVCWKQRKFWEGSFCAA